MARPYHAIISDFEEAPGRQLFSPIFFFKDSTRLFALEVPSRGSKQSI